MIPIKEEPRPSDLMNMEFPRQKKQLNHLGHLLDEKPKPLIRLLQKQHNFRAKEKKAKSP